MTVHITVPTDSMRLGRKTSFCKCMSMRETPVQLLEYSLCTEESWFQLGAKRQELTSICVIGFSSMF